MGARRRDQRLVGSSPEAGRGYQKLAGSSSGAYRRSLGAYRDDVREFTRRRPRDSSEDRRGLPKEIRSLPGWRLGVHQKKTERLVERSSGVAEKLTGSWKGVMGLVGHIDYN
ncbi:hypothetical protein GW17_00031390 [Ensete ventricosum]|nr:hypothetical protein GW17_00031390 [Ensete ventricosum]